MCVFPKRKYNKYKGGLGKLMKIKIFTEEQEMMLVEKNDLSRLAEKYKNEAEFSLEEGFVKCYQTNVLANELKGSKKKELAFVVLVILRYIEPYTNRLEKLGKPLGWRDLMELCDISKSVAYNYLKQLTDLDIINKVKVDGKWWYYVNPLFFQKSAKCLTSTLRLFKNRSKL